MLKVCISDRSGLQTAQKHLLDPANPNLRLYNLKWAWTFRNLTAYRFRLCCECMSDQVGWNCGDKVKSVLPLRMNSQYLRHSGMILDFKRLSLNDWFTGRVINICNLNCLLCSCACFYKFLWVLRFDRVKFYIWAAEC